MHPDSIVRVGQIPTLYDPPRAALLPEMVVQHALVTAHALFHSSQQLRVRV